ncbi:CinA family protein [Alteromonas sediminis]|uniref:CinA family protein n=1 Tax=Alteromonas sediminis TaxID=2259342 RepID=A0A3N5Y475_9ALTE|nr:CinA family protein [Alteromonas sediminis]RPJ68270.1 CinA family protein [Alteromonas sediminis]
MLKERQQQLEVLAQTLSEKKWTVTCAESCTGGGLAFAFTSVSGSSNWFSQSWVTYSNDAKINRLGVDEDIIERYGAVSMQTVKQMATGARREAAADIAVSISGIAGPGGGSKEKPVGLVWFGFAFADYTLCEKQVFDGGRQRVREQAIDFAIQKLIQGLVE